MRKAFKVYSIKKWNPDYILGTILETRVLRVQVQINNLKIYQTHKGDAQGSKNLAALIIGEVL